MTKEKDNEFLKLIEQEIHSIDDSLKWIAGFLSQYQMPPPVQPPIQKEELTDPEPPPAQPAEKSKLPKWEQEKLEKEKTVEKPKQKLGLNRLIILLIIAAVLIGIALFLRGQGWTCAIPGM